MSDEIVKYDTETELAGYLDSLRGPDEELEELAAETNPFDTMPQLKLSKESKDINAILGEETEATFSSRNPLYLCLLLVCERRTLWRPDGMKRNDEDGRFPVCSTPNCKVGTFRRDNDRGVGTWNVKDNQDLLDSGGSCHDDDYPEGEWPENELTSCSTCKWNQFGSSGDWDVSRGEGRGKACNESRLIIGAVCSAVKQYENGLKIFDFDPNGSRVYMSVPATSIKAIKQIGSAAVARKTPARYMVFKLGNEPQSSGSIRWGQLTQEFVGFVAPQRVKDCDTESNNFRDMIFREEVAPPVDDPETETEVKNEVNPEYGF